MESIRFHNQLTYEEVLNWQGFAFETSRAFHKQKNVSLLDSAFLHDDGRYGLEEAQCIIDNVVHKQVASKLLGVDVL